MFNELQWVPFHIEAYINRAIAYKRIDRSTPDYIEAILETNSYVYTIEIPDFQT